MTVITFKDLKVWQESMKLVTDIYTLQKSFPKYEMYGICDQLRRASVSIPINIAEGKLRSTNADFRRFIFIALGSIAEVETLLELSMRLRYTNKDDLKKVMIKISEIRKMLHGLKNHLTT